MCGNAASWWRHSEYGCRWHPKRIDPYGGRFGILARNRTLRAGRVPHIASLGGGLIQYGCPRWNDNRFCPTSRVNPIHCLKPYRFRADYGSLCLPCILCRVRNCLKPKRQNRLPDHKRLRRVNSLYCCWCRHWLWNRRFDPLSANLWLQPFRQQSRRWLRRCLLRQNLYLFARQRLLPMRGQA